MRAEDLKDKNFLVIGRVGMDLCPDPPGTATQDATSMIATMGGSSANIAAGLCKLGCKSTLVTCVSDDSVGDFCLNQLDHYGIDNRYVRKIIGEERTSLAVYESRVKNHKSVIYRNNAADFQMSVEDIEAIDFSHYSALITAGTVFAQEPSRSATFKAFERAKEAGIPIIFDVDYRPYSWPSPQVAEDILSKAGALSDVVVGNDEEFGFMAGSIEKGLDKAHSLAEKAGSIIVYKMGEKGAITLCGGDEITTGIFPVTALKPTGAGDSFMAGFIAALANGLSLYDAVLRGSACASITVSKVGCALAMPFEDELDSFMAAHDYLESSVKGTH